MYYSRALALFLLGRENQSSQGQTKFDLSAAAAAGLIVAVPQQPSLPGIGSIRTSAPNEGLPNAKVYTTASSTPFTPSSELRFIIQKTANGHCS